MAFPNTASPNVPPPQKAPRSSGQGRYGPGRHVLGGHRPGRHWRLVLAVPVLLTLAGCDTGFDLDLRHLAGGFTTTPAVQERLSANRPSPDSRGIISYPSYQVAVARRGDTVTDLARRIGASPAELARYNGLPADAPLRAGELVVLPGRVAEPADGPITPSPGAPHNNDTIEIATLAGNALDRAEASTRSTTATAPTPAAAQAALSHEEPARHRVKRGETAYSIARAYNVSVRALADWNGLDSALTVREGQFLLIPPTATIANAPDPVESPGRGSRTPVPPSAAEPLPEPTAPAAAATAPPAPDIGAAATAASAARMVLPTDGRIIRAYERGKTDGIDIAASAGSAVVAAADGTVAAITRDTEQVPILVIRHPNNVLTVYANIDGITVSKGDRVSRGQKIAVVRAGTPAFLHFQVREGTRSVDPETYLN